MLRGLPASIMAHAAVIGASYITFPYWGASRMDVADFEVVDVEFAEIGEITNIAPTVDTEPEEPEAAPEEPEEVLEDPVEEELPEAEQDVSNETATPLDENPEDVLPDFEPEETEPDPEPEREPEPEPETRPTPPRDALSDFLNQSESTFKSEIETRRDRPPPRPAPPEETPRTDLKDAPRPADTRNQRGAGERNANTARIEAILYSRIVPCWDDVVDLPFPERLNVRLRVSLNQNGTVENVTLIEPAREPIGNAPMRTAIDRAKRAVRKCAPYNLPDDDYDLWREGVVNLGPAFAPTSQR